MKHPRQAHRILHWVPDREHTDLCEIRPSFLEYLWWTQIYKRSVHELHDIVLNVLRAPGMAKLWIRM